MTTLVLERFAQLSRRCDPKNLHVPADDTRLCELAFRYVGAGHLLRDAGAAAAGWLSVSSRLRWKLARACFATGGARTGAFLRAPALARCLQSGAIDSVACFSNKDFALAKLIAAETGSTCHQMLSYGTQYFGEFAFELLAVVPYAYWLQRQGLLEFTIASPDTRCLYYFSPRHDERAVQRGYVPITEYPIGQHGTLRYDRKAFPSTLDTRQWLPPPYKSVYRDDRFGWTKEVCIVCNKVSDEQYRWHRQPTNVMHTDLLLAAIGKLRQRYQVIYNRPRAADIVNDHQRIHEIGDIDSIKRAYPDVLTIQELHAAHPALSFNELQLRLFADCGKFVSVLGGSSYLASYFGGTNVVYARRGWEVACGAYDRWFDRFSGARVVAASTPTTMLQAIERELC